jgi:hypothetical protein
MRGRLQAEQIAELVDVTVQLGLYDSRDTLLLHVPPNFRSVMPTATGGRPRDQLVQDLNCLNDAGVLSDGSDPLRTWLINAINSSGGVREAEVFERTLAILPQPAERQEEAQMEGPRPQLSLVQSAAEPSVRRLRGSADALRNQIQSIATSYGTDQDCWVWDKDLLHDELDAACQHLKAIGVWLDEAERSASGLRQALSRHGAVTDRFLQRLDDLEAPQTLTAQRSMRRREFERAAESLLGLLDRIQEELRSLGSRDHSPRLS